MKTGKYKKHYRCPLCLGKGKVLMLRQYSPVVRAKARKLFRNGWSLREIGKEIGVKTAQQVKSLIIAKTL